MTGREFKDTVFEQFAKIAHAFSSPKRLEIIDILAQGERDVDSLSKQVQMTVANTSRHLQTLKSIRLVASRKAGVQVFYRLADGEVRKCFQRLQSLAEKRSMEIREIVRLFFEERDGMEPISKDDLWKRVQNNDVIVLDVRPSEEYKKGHIPGALSIPLSQLKKRLDEIPKGREVVAYCRGPYCVLSAEAMEILRNAGYKAVRLKEGLPEWKEAGLPVEET
ncbi:MAG: ArsR/SmtB family transcription factor [bacterium]